VKPIAAFERKGTLLTSIKVRNKANICIGFSQEMVQDIDVNRKTLNILYPLIGLSNQIQFNCLIPIIYVGYLQAAVPFRNMMNASIRHNVH